MTSDLGAPDPRPPAKRSSDWRNSVRLAADLALLGIVITVLSLPLVTAGAAVAAGSTAIHHLVTEGRWPSFTDLWAAFRRRLVPGLLAGPAVALAVVLVALDLAALRRGAVPGGGPAIALVLAAAALAAGLAALVAVQAGAVASGAIRSAGAVAAAHPVAPVAAAGVLVVAALLAMLVHPVLVPVLAGCSLYALHAVVRRFVVEGAPMLDPAP